MNKVEEIESVIAQLPLQDFDKLASWMAAQRPKQSQDHSAFLNSYAPGDEGLYDDAIAR